MSEVRHLLFHSDGVDEDLLHVVRFEGKEEMSRPYRYEIDLVSRDREIKLEDVVNSLGWLGIRQGIKLSDGARALHTRKLSGWISAFEQHGLVNDLPRYYAVLVPRFSRLARSRRTRVFTEKTVPEILEKLLKEHGLSGEDYDLGNLGDEHPRRSYVLQYEESDLDFISRWLEHEGIFYFFEETEGGDKIVFGETVGAYVPVAEGDEIPYKPEVDEPGAQSDAGEIEEAGQDWFREEAVHSFSCRLNTAPKKLVLNDYNWRTPNTSLKVSSEVDDGGVGRVTEYSNHYKNSDEGKTLAKIRAEEILCRQKLFTGAGECRAFRPGATYKLTDHFRPDFNEQYLLTEVVQVGTQSVALGSSGDIGATYKNRFASIPTSGAVFRPERTTPKPRIPGAINAKIDHGGDDKAFADLNEDGCYRVALPCDPDTNIATLLGGKGSRWVRKAEPYSGADSGLHFPLHQGAEVILMHVNGDPDRPVIVGAVPNRDTTPQVDSWNHKKNLIRTAGTNDLEIDDEPGQEGFRLTNRKMGAVRQMRARPRP